MAKLSYKDNIVNGVKAIEKWIDDINNRVGDGGGSDRELYELDEANLRQILEQMNPTTYECDNDKCGVDDFTVLSGQCPACHQVGKSKGRYAK